MVWRSKVETVCGCCLLFLLQAGLFLAAPALLPREPETYPQLDVDNFGEEARSLQQAYPSSPRDDQSADHRHSRPLQSARENIEELPKLLADTLQWEEAGLRGEAFPHQFPSLSSLLPEQVDLGHDSKLSHRPYDQRVDGTADDTNKNDDQQFNPGAQTEDELKQLGGQFYEKTVSNDGEMLLESEGRGKVPNKAKDSDDDRKSNNRDLDKSEDGEKTLDNDDDDANDEELKKLAAALFTSNADEADLQKLQPVSEGEHDGKSLKNAMDVGSQDRVADRGGDNQYRGYRESSARESAKRDGDGDVPKSKKPTSKVDDYKPLKEETKKGADYLMSQVKSTQVNDYDSNHANDVGKDEQWTNARPGSSSLRVIELNDTIYINTTDDHEQPQFQPVAIPDRFEDYDVNKDGVISLPELRHVTGAVEGALQAFRDADLNGNGWIDEVEFKSSGWGAPVVLYSAASPIYLADSGDGTSPLLRPQRK